MVGDWWYVIRKDHQQLVTSHFLLVGHRDDGRLAQSGERCLHTAEVTGSIPVPPTINKYNSPDLAA